MATIKDVARLAEMSTATVSRYLKQPDIVSSAAKIKIKDAIKQLGYEPNSIASMLKSMRSNIVGLIISDTANPFFNNLIKALNKLFLDSNKRLIVLYDDEHLDFAAQIRALISLRVEAVMFIPTRKSQTVENIMHHNKCYALQLFIDHYEDFDSLIINDRLGSYLAAKELINNNHRKLLLIDYKNEIFFERLKGFKEALTESNIKYENSMCLAFEDRNFDEHHNAIMDAVRNSGATGIISVTDTLTQHVTHVLSEAGLDFPDDYSLVMYDESSWANLQDITTLSHPFDDMTHKIKKMLLKNLDLHPEYKQQIPEKVVVDPQIIHRKSIRKIL